MRRLSWVILTALILAPSSGLTAAQGAAAKPAATPAAPAGTGPTLVIETSKGTIQIQMFPADAPKSVAHITALAKRNFYNGQRVHRVVKGFVIQFGDPQSRDMTKRDLWGTRGSGKPIGAAEIKRRHGLGAVALAHAGDPKLADSQMYIALAPQPQLDSNFTVFGQVTSGMEVAQRIAVNDVVKKVSVKP